MRSVGLSILKTICCFSAVTFYTTSRLCTDSCFINHYTLSFLYYLSIIATPLFFMINGYVDTTDKLSKRVAFDRVLAVLSIFVFWNLISYFAFQKIIQQSYFLQSWLLLSLALIYLLNPFFSYLLSYSKRAIIVLVGFIIVTFLFDLLSFFRKKTLIENIPDYFRVWTWFFYYLLGRFLALREWKSYFRQHSVRRFAMLAILPTFILLVSYEKIITAFIFQKVNAGYFLDSIFVLASCLWLFIIFDSMHLKSKPAQKFFLFVAPAMIGVYILHDGVFFYISKLFPVEYANYPFLNLISVFFISVMLSRLLLLNRWSAKLVSF